ncbi:family 43 glycosylhydrolase [Gracilibacillus alcaliphilus]|uniref:family 43 glycosylhydrolase n=1 Tax=Gracilibacillus alcaliphilus TaxID=1401441 RepID=UPI00195C829A|nr:family 43 glycosylhydrolase [Gracilibacillus alcaliphilus]MBM7675696.1 beta-xylosidase [Gracilibacillus alcaliphilus]
MSAYVLVHFIGEEKNGEQVYFSVSQDGLHFHDLNTGQPVLQSTIGEEGVRDPFLIRDAKHGKFYIIATDLRIEKGLGWEYAQEKGSRDIIIWESTDLVYWEGPRAVSVGVPEAGNVWAPEAIYDEEKESFLVFWASKVDGKHRMYASYTADFKGFSDPFVYMEKDRDVIDSTVAYENGYYYRFTKDETTSRIIMERAKNLTGIYENVSSPVLEELAGVEGPEIYQLPDGNTWCLIVDRFMEGKGYMILQSNHLSSGHFTVLDEEAYDFGQHQKRHGGVLPITTDEYQRLLRYYDQKNPVLPGLHADPDLVSFNGMFYLYPTTDGFTGWSGTSFKVFQSKDLDQFEDAVEIVQLTSDQVPWAVGSAWAPCITSRNGYYYYYFCGKRPDGLSCIGMAQSSSPTGPFTAEAEPILTPEMIDQYGLDMAQMIDPAIYEEAGEYYILFGNGETGAIAKLTEDMAGIHEETIKNLRGLENFREAVTVLKRDNLYHFTWSCDDTGSENYHVNYGVSTSLYGPIEYKYPILTKNSAKHILGTGHHSILQIPGTDSFYIAYHRFGTPLEQFPEGKGYHRETCISPLDFNQDGLMRPVIVD